MSLRHGCAIDGLTTPEYKAWCSMKARCLTTTHFQYEGYGGRGIKIYEPWLKFENFVMDVGLRPTDMHSLDRIDNNGNYEPGNVRWATKKVQANNRRNTRYVDTGSGIIPLAVFAEIVGIKFTTLAKRWRSGKRAVMDLIAPIDVKKSYAASKRCV